MDSPILQILIQKGPKSGTNFTCKPGSKFKIGRVVKGNNFSIRESSISQNHLAFEFIPKDSRWFVTDLDSSNGTSLNGSDLEAHVPVPVSDGDVVKIGDKSELLLKIVKTEKEDEKKVPRRGTTRVLKAVEAIKESEIRVSEAVEAPKEGESRVSRNRRNARSNEVIDLDKEEETDGSKYKFASDLGKIEETKEEKSRVLRSTRKNNRAIEEAKKNETLLNSDLNVDLGEIEKGKKTRGRSKIKDVTENPSRVIDEKVEIEEPEENKEIQLRRNPKRGNSSRVLKNLDGISAKDKGKGKQIVGQTSNLDNKIENEINNSNLENELGNEKEINSEESRVDLEKMTLAEWFDRMEVYLPKVIAEEAEKIINDIRTKAQKMDEFLAKGGQYNDAVV